MVWDCKKHNFNKYILAEIQHIFGFENKEIPASPKTVLLFRNFVNFVKASTLEINQNALIGKIFPKYKKRNKLLKWINLYSQNESTWNVWTNVYVPTFM